MGDPGTQRLLTAVARETVLPFYLGCLEGRDSGLLAEPCITTQKWTSLGKPRLH